MLENWDIFAEQSFHSLTNFARLLDEKLFDEDKTPSFGQTPENPIESFLIFFLSLSLAS